MAHAGTMVGGSAQTKQGGSPWPAIALAVAVVVATIGGVWLASSAGLIGGTAKPAADRSYDQYLNGILDRAHAAPYAGGATTLSNAGSQARADALNGILDRAHAAPYAGGAVTLSVAGSQARTEYLNGILDRAHAAPFAGGAVETPAADGQYDTYLDGILDRAHAAPYAGS